MKSSLCLYIWEVFDNITLILPPSAFNFTNEFLFAYIYWKNFAVEGVLKAQKIVKGNDRSQSCKGNEIVL